MRLDIARASLFGFGVVMMVLGVAGQAFAGAATAVPEIDGGTMSAGFAAASAAALILRSRLRRK